CKHFTDTMTCKAFDLIPEKFLLKAESHTSVVPGQNGNYVFETDKPRRTRRAFYFVDTND
ncbi:MAG: hypothetical protein LUE27_09400, partial [Clostridia bacterium]|nr:hypothetical protein [Clostridia bacterium]